MKAEQSNSLKLKIILQLKLNVSENKNNAHKCRIKGTVMQFEKALINDRLRASKVSWNSHFNCLWFCSNLPVKFAIFKKVAYCLTVSIVFPVYKQNFTAQ